MNRTLLILWLFIFPGCILAQEDGSPFSFIPDTAAPLHPWNHLNFKTAPGKFSFAVVGDRTGGHRPGIFEDAVRKLNLLQPEFVIGVGDLIEGYTEDREDLLREWDEFDTIIRQLEMPFFYVPGNHDYANEVGAGIWQERYGRSYYCFLYKDVLFLCLNSEEALPGWDAGGIQKSQYDHVKTVLEQYRNVRWTMVFIHQPLWLLDSSGYWKEVEELLRGRPHTVFSGHKHQYVKYERNNADYIVMATTGGISRLRGTPYGEFDHVVWVALTGDEPAVTNLLLDGIWDKNVVTEKQTEMIGSLRMEIDPIFVEDNFREGEFRLKIRNEANYPMWTVLRFGSSRYLVPEILEFQKSVPPNSVERLNIPVSSRYAARLGKMQPITLYAWYVYQYEDGRKIEVDQQYGLVPVQKNYLKKAESPVTVDADLKEWAGLPYRAGLGSIVTTGRDEYQGDFDAQFDFNVTYDDANLYLALTVWDDKLEVDRQQSVRVRDAVLVRIDPRPVPVSSNNRTDNRIRNDGFYLMCSPSLSARQSPLIDHEELLPEGTRVATRKSIEGFNLELSVPLDYFHRMGGEDWESFRLNLAYFDFDNKDPKTSIWWEPNWSTPDNYIGSGTFFRVPDE